MTDSPPATAACKNLVWQEAGYYRCSLLHGHRSMCVPDPAHIAYDEAIARRVLADAIRRHHGVLNA